MWTIIYEFRCYILAALLAVLGFYRRPALYYAFTVVPVTAAIVLPFPIGAEVGRMLRPVEFLFGAVVGDLDRRLRLRGQPAAAAGCNGRGDARRLCPVLAGAQGAPPLVPDA